MKTLLRFILLLALAVPLWGQDSSHTAYRILGTGSSPTSCTYSATADPVIVYSGTVYVCGVLGTYVSVGNLGTVTSVTFTGDGTVLSSTPSAPVTATGTLTAALNTQSMNVVLAGPTTGAATYPTFRSLVGADLPNPSASTLGGVQSIAAVQGEFVNSISTSGVPTLALPDCSPLNLTSICFDEEFLTANNTSKGIGTYGWEFTAIVGGSPSVAVNQPMGWPFIGNVQLNTAATKGDGISLDVRQGAGLVGTSTSNGLGAQTNWDSYFIYAALATSGVVYRVGYATNQNAVVVPQDSMGLRFDETLKDITAATYTSGGSFTGTVTQTCNASFLGGTAVGTLALTGTNTVAGSTAFVITNMGAGYSSVQPTTKAVLTSGTATCSGTATVAVTNGSAASGADTTLHLCSTSAGTYLEQCYDTLVSPDTSAHILRVRAVSSGEVGMTLDNNAEVTFCSSACTVTVTPTTGYTVVPAFQVVSDTASTAEELNVKSWRFKAWGLTQ